MSDMKIIEEQIPEWQKEETRKRLSELKENPSLLLDEDAFWKAIDEDEQV